MKRSFIIFYLLAAFCVTGNAQLENHKWKTLVVNDQRKIWFDENTLEKAKGIKFEIWLLELHVPPLTFESISGDIHRSKILYAVDLNLAKYGIGKVVYYDSGTRELYRFDYHIRTLEDNVKYTHPILENSPIHKVIKELNKNRENEAYR